MRLRHRKWADQVLSDNKDIGKNLSDFDPESLKTFRNLEIGSGCGGFLIELSARHPESTYLGVEINLNAFSVAIKKASEVKDTQKNFMFLNSPIEKVISLIGDHQLDNIYLNFSDPWPKKRQKHRRLSYPTLHPEYARILKEDGHLYFRTDNIDLFNESVEYFQESGIFDFEVIQPFYSEKVDYLPPTEYESKFRAKGVDINLLIATPKKKA